MIVQREEVLRTQRGGTSFCSRAAASGKLGRFFFRSGFTISVSVPWKGAQLTRE